MITESQITNHIRADHIRPDHRSTASADRPFPQWAIDLGISVPLICAPMGGAAGGALASKVSRAGGLGTIGMGSAGSVSSLESQLALLADGVPFGIGLVDWAMQRSPDLFERAIAARPRLISVSFGDWSVEPPWVARLRQERIMSATQVANATEARAAADAGVDLIVARGLEAGGHGAPEEPRAALLDAVVAAVPDRPVLMAGAIGTADDATRAIEAGAAGVWAGTALAAARESLFSNAARAALVAAGDNDTMITRAVDVGLGYPWPERFPERVLRTEFAERWTGREADLLQTPEALDALRSAHQRGDVTVVPVNGGTGVTHITAVRPAADIVREISRGLPRATA